MVQDRMSAVSADSRQPQHRLHAGLTLFQGLAVFDQEEHVEHKVKPCKQSRKQASDVAIA
jgi:hypothetical protein